MTAGPSATTPSVDTVMYVGADACADAVFDEATHTWTVGGRRRARVLIATDACLPAALACRADGLRPYLGVAVHGVPNYFVLAGADTAAQKAYVAKCLAHMARTDSTRIEVRSSAQRFYNEHSPGAARRRAHYWRKMGRRIPSMFEVRSLAFDLDFGDEVYDGPATVVIAGRHHGSHVRLTGRLDPIDGHYHWQGTVFDTGFEVRMPQEVSVIIDDRTAEGRLTERTPWNTYSVVGKGAPPFALDELQTDATVL